MKFSLEIRSDIGEPEVVVIAPEWSTELDSLRSYVLDLDEGGTQVESMRLVGIDGGNATLIKPSQIMRIRTQDRNIYADTRQGSWRLKQRLRELEETLPAEDFIRINQGEIVNLSFVSRMDLSLSGTIALTLLDGTKCFVSRRSLKRFKSALKL
ncbi:LytTR family DNA-binding domain-containing protein [Boudabousia marimammalium]|nr:LytTR family DNA-binding domain-containing protein [Boudabousia marimammalium]